MGEPVVYINLRQQFLDFAGCECVERLVGGRHAGDANGDIARYEALTACVFEYSSGRGDNFVQGLRSPRLALAPLGKLRCGWCGRPTPYELGHHSVDIAFPSVGHGSDAIGHHSFAGPGRWLVRGRPGPTLPSVWSSCADDRTGGLGCRCQRVMIHSVAWRRVMKRRGFLIGT